MVRGPQCPDSESIPRTIGLMRVGAAPARGTAPKAPCPLQSPQRRQAPARGEGAEGFQKSERGKAERT